MKKRETRSSDDEIHNALEIEVVDQIKRGETLVKKRDVHLEYDTRICKHGFLPKKNPHRK